MKPKKLTILTKIQIAESREKVFHTVSNARDLSKFFVSEASLNLETGNHVIWKFPEFKSMQVKVKVIKADSPEIIVLNWEGAENHITTVTFMFTAIGNGQTLLAIKEEEMLNNEHGIAWLARNTEGWANFLASLKAYLEYGINLRKGAFEFLKYDDS